MTRGRARRAARRTGGAAALAILVGVAAIGCGKTGTADQDAAVPPATTAPPKTTAPPTTADKTADAKAAKKALLTVDDLPGSGWTVGQAREKGPSTSNELADACPDLSEQLKQFKELSDAASEAKSPKFLNKARQVDLEEDIAVFADEDQSTTIANVLGDKAFADCLGEFMAGKAKDDPSSGIDPASITSERAAVGKLGDDHTVFVLRMDAKNPKTSQTAKITFVIAFVRVGRGYISATYTTSADVKLDADVVPVLTAASDDLKRQLAS